MKFSVISPGIFGDAGTAVTAETDGHAERSRFNRMKPVSEFLSL